MNDIDDSGSSAICTSGFTSVEHDDSGSQVEIELDNSGPNLPGGAGGAGAAGHSSSGSSGAASLAASLGLTLPPPMKPDDEVEACERCGSKFTLLNRRHHCRACGNIFCGVCSKERRLLPPKYTYEVPVRVCVSCVEANIFWPFHSKVVSTDKGDVEYVSVGEGSKVVLVFHGGPGGYDQGLLYAHPLWTDGMESYFTVISFSRPGSLLTPLESGPTFEEQADLAASLLDTLSVTGKVGVIGANTGGPAAIQFAVRHPNRTAALALLSAITKPYWMGQGKGKPLAEAGPAFGSRLFLGPLQGVAVWGTRTLPGTALQNFLEQSTNWTEGEAAIHSYNINRNPTKKWIFQALVLSMHPISDRKAGFENDLALLRELEPLPIDRISVPTLILHGLDDADVLKDHAEHVKDSLPTFATLHIYKSTGPNVYLGTEADQVRDTMIRFLSENVIA